MEHCIVCKEVIPESRYDKHHKVVRYCSKKCIKVAWYKKNVKPKHDPNYVCLYCGNGFVAKFKKDAKYCSGKCWYKGEDYGRNEKKLAKEKEWIKNNPEKVRHYHRTNYSRNKEVKRLYSRLRNTAKIREKAEWVKICESQDFRCNHCLQVGTIHTLQIDHIVPFSRGGSNNLSNLQALCGTCNKRKGNRFVG